VVEWVGEDWEIWSNGGEETTALCCGGASLVDWVGEAGDWGRGSGRVGESGPRDLSREGRGAGLGCAEWVVLGRVVGSALLRASHAMWLL
jgi:hypothetical protein